MVQQNTKIVILFNEYVCRTLRTARQKAPRFLIIQIGLARSILVKHV